MILQSNGIFSRSGDLGMCDKRPPNTKRTGSGFFSLFDLSMIIVAA